MRAQGAASSCTPDPACKEGIPNKSSPGLHPPQVHAQREAFRRQTSKKLLLNSSQTSAQGADAEGGSDAEQGLQAVEHADLAALAGRLAAQQQEIEHLNAQLEAANAKRAELAKVCPCCQPGLLHSFLPVLAGQTLRC